MVIVGSRLLEEQQELCEILLGPCLMAWPIVQELGERQMLAGPFDEAYRPLIGRTRTIVIPEEKEALEVSAMPAHLDGLLRRAIRILSVLEWGFTLRTASLLLSEHEGFSGRDIREQVLIPLERHGFVRAAEGRYHIPRPVLRSLKAALDHAGPSELAALHYRAGLAVASFASRSDHPALALDVAFNPEHIKRSGRSPAPRHSIRPGGRGFPNPL